MAASDFIVLLAAITSRESIREANCVSIMEPRTRKGFIVLGGVLAVATFAGLIVGLILLTSSKESDDETIEETTRFEFEFNFPSTKI